jgi:hypothetical protein
MRRKQDTVDGQRNPPTPHPRPSVHGYAYVLICLVITLVVSAQGAGAPTVFECFAATVSAGVQLTQYVKPSIAKPGC